MPIRPFVLGLDLDGVVGAYNDAFRQYVARIKGVEPDTLPDPEFWSYKQSGWFDSEEEYLAAHAAAVDHGMFRTMPLIPGAEEALWELSDAGVHIRVVTHRLGAKGTHARAAGDTVAWLDSSGKRGIPYRDLTFVSAKADVGCSVYIDDAPHNIENLRAAGNTAIVFDQLYNRHVDGPRARDWSQARDLILELKQEHERAQAA